MCGFIGLVSAKPLVRNSFMDNQFGKAYLHLRSRGPDEKGIWTDRYSYLLHTRLKILDLSPLSAQPMVKNNYVICFNGEIYNFQEIKDKLTKKGYFFKSTGDTEVILHAWQEWGEEMLQKLDGMFSFAILDKKNKNLFLARDRFGKKPLIYSIRNNNIYFASDVRSLSCITDGGEINKKAIHSLFRFRFIHEPMTIYNNFYKLPPGSLLCFNKYGKKIRYWYSLKKPTISSHKINAQSIKSTIKNAVKKRLISDVSIGVFLSGGIDSAIILQSLAEMGRKIPTYTIGFKDEVDYYNESENAKKISNYYGFENKTILLNSNKVKASINDVLDANDEPFADSSSIPTYMISEAVKNDIKVALTGDGGDELFGGYRKYSAYKWTAIMKLLPDKFKKKIALTLPDSKNNFYLNNSRKLKRLLESYHSDFKKMQINLLDQISKEDFNELFGIKKKGPPNKLFKNTDTFDDPLNNVLARDFCFSLLGDMLVKLDRNSMANSLELRSPFLDKDLVEKSFNIPGKNKVGFFKGKKILKECYEGYIPKWYFNLPKKGFEVPLQRWLKTDLKYLVNKSTETKVLESLNIKNKNIINNWKEGLMKNNKDNSWKIWTLVVYSHWARKTKLI